MKASTPWIRQSQRVIRMVSEVHRTGFQQLRIMPYEYPLAYRVAIGPKSMFSMRNGAYMQDPDYSLITTYSSASGHEYFGWRDAKTDNARTLAEKFVERFAPLAMSGAGRDWEYAGWLAELLSAFEEMPARLPILMAEYFEPSPSALTVLPMRLYGEREGTDLGDDAVFPLPPPGSRRDTVGHRDTQRIHRPRSVSHSVPFPG